MSNSRISGKPNTLTATEVSAQNSARLQQALESKKNKIVVTKFSATPGFVMTLSGMLLLFGLIIYLYVNASKSSRLGKQRTATGEIFYYNYTVSTTIHYADPGVWEILLPLITGLLCAGMAVLKPQHTTWDSISQTVPILICFTLIASLRHFHNNPVAVHSKKEYEYGNANVVHGLLTLVALLSLATSMGLYTQNQRMTHEKIILGLFVGFLILGIILIAWQSFYKGRKNWEKRGRLMNAFAVCEWSLLLILFVHIIYVSVLSSSSDMYVTKLKN